MEDADFSDDFCRFIQSAIPSVDAAESLLALMTAEGQPVPVSPGEPSRLVEALRACGLVELDRHGRACFAPATPELRRHAQTLANAYRERPVTLIRVIYALRDAKIKSFAEAFRIRKP
jgi:hypothetical protein